MEKITTAPISREEWDALKYGNVITGPGGQDKFVVLHVIRNDKNQVEHIGLIPAIDFEKSQGFDGVGYNVVSKRSSQTYLAGRSVE